MLFTKISNSNMPRWFKWLLNITLAITCVYWLGLLLYRVIEIVRTFLHKLTDHDIFWVIIGLLFIVGCIGLAVLYFCYGINVFALVWDFVKSKLPWLEF